MKALIKRPNLPPSLEDVPLLSEAPSQDTLLVQVITVGLCRTDILVAQGRIPRDESVVLGHEFSGIVLHDPLGHWTGKQVVVNPLYPNRQFMGLDFDGALVERVVVPRAQTFLAEGIDPRIAAYVEPVAASMALLNVRPSGKGAVYGNNRIALLTHTIAKSHGLDIDLIDETELEKEVDSNGKLPLELVESYDYMVETLFEETHIERMLSLLKVGGTLIVKSRKRSKVGLDASTLVAKELSLQAVNYFDFQQALDWLRLNEQSISFLLGDDYTIDQWQDAFECASSGESNKTFISF